MLCYSLISTLPEALLPKPLFGNLMFVGPCIIMITEE